MIEYTYKDLESSLRNLEKLQLNDENPLRRESRQIIMNGLKNTMHSIDPGESVLDDHTFQQGVWN